MPVQPPTFVDPFQGVPLLITRRQRAELRERGFSDEAVRIMTPNEAHRLLAEGRTASVQPTAG